MPSAFVKSFRVCLWHLSQRMTHQCSLRYTHNSHTTIYNITFYLLPFRSRGFPSLITYTGFRSRLVTLVTLFLSGQPLIRRLGSLVLQVTGNVPGRGWASQTSQRSSFAQTRTCSTARRDPWTKFSCLSFHFFQPTYQCLAVNVHNFGPFFAHLSQVWSPNDIENMTVNPFL